MELADHTAGELALLLRSAQVSAREVLAANLQRIEAVNPSINAIVTVCAERAERQAAWADEELALGRPTGPLHGLPVAHKDLFETAGIRTTYGSPIFADHTPDTDALIVTRAREAGAITVGKTNTPEFGAGSHTFNPVFGPTTNPADPRRSAGGSSGGAAAALAAGMVALADGSDLGGSLRNPASFCGVVGLRPSPGRIPSWPTRLPWDSMSVAGPMGRTVGDVALFLSALAGPDPRVPVSLDDPGDLFAPPLGSPGPLRVAFSPRLGDLPVDAAVAAVAAGVADRLADAGMRVVEADPPLQQADFAFETLRAWAMEATRGRLYDTEGDRMKETLRWNIETGRSLRGPTLGEAELARGSIFSAVDRFFDDHDVILTVTSQVPPFPVDVEYPTEVAGVAMGSYIEWMRSCSRITVTSCPALSLPAGIVDGLPVGVQLVTRYRSERRLLEIAAFVERLVTVA